MEQSTLGSQVILPDFVTPSRVDQQWNYTGIDSRESCRDIVRFKGYPHQFNYQYNSRGFRDCEWPDNLQSAVWCIGDSFTVGLGAPIEHSWPRQLETVTGLKTINVSMDGASNDWIARKALRVSDVVHPQTIVVQWSYLHRRELDIDTARAKLWDNFYSAVRDTSWPKTAKFDQLSKEIQQEITTTHAWPVLLSDEMRVVHNLKTTVEDDIDHTIEHIQRLGNRVVHTFIPDFIDPANRDYFYARLAQTGIDYIKDLTRLDLARDGHHYDIKTARQYAEKIKSALERRAS
jgi:hypothetical protein